MDTRERVSATEPGARIDYLDLLRGVAVLGILWMNAISFGMPDTAYYRLDWQGWSWPTDKLVGVVARVVFDQKMMGMFSLLFGASIVLFVERVAQRRSHPVRLSMWRNTLLLGMGVVHISVWDGDVLLLYALCSPLLLVLRKLPDRTLFSLAGALFGILVLWSLWLQGYVNEMGPQTLGFFWVDDENWPSWAVEAWFLADAFFRALAMMMIGVGLYRTGVLTGSRPAAWYRRLAVIGFVTGLPLALANVALQVRADFSADVAITSFALNTLATIPVTLGILGAVMWWAHPESDRPGAALRKRLQAVGRMALTNYLTQTAFGLLVLGSIAELADLHRTQVALFVVSVWAVQLWWSPWWLDRFQMGPMEWLWRVATYRRWQPLRRSSNG